jgi:hypothetical protein
MTTKISTTEIGLGSITADLLSETAISDKLGFVPASSTLVDTKFNSSGGVISGTVTITQDLSVTGNIFLAGNTTSISANNININDPLIYLAQNNPSNLNDIGLVGHFTSGNYQHTGIARDHTDGIWKFFSNVSTEPTSTVNFGEANIVYDGVRAGNVQFTSVGVGTAASGTTGEIRATNDITAFYSDDRLKTKLGNIENALDKLCTLSGFYYEPNQTAQDLGYEIKRHVGVSAQEVQSVMPEVVKPAPISDQYLTVQYDKLVPLLIQAIKELKAEVDSIKGS